MSLKKKEMFRKQTMKLTANDIRIDGRCQRALLPAWQKKLTETLDLDLLGVLTVSLRADGKYYCIDGQHRLVALRDNGLGDWKVTCHVYRNLRPEDEAWLFVRQNTQRRPVGSWDAYDKGLNAGDPDCVAVSVVAKAAGLKPSNQTGKGLLACVAAARSIVGQDGADAPVLEWALRVTLEAWGANGGSLDGKIVQGLAIIGKKHMKVIDRDAFVKKISSYHGGPTRLLGDARGYSDSLGGSVAKNVARVCMTTYNKGRRSGVLEIG